MAPKEIAGMFKDLSGCQNLERHEEGRQAFVAMLRAWRARSGLSLQDFQDLCELAMRHDLAPGVPGWLPRPYSRGELVVANGGVWRARDVVLAPEDAPQRGEAEQNGPFELVVTVRRLFTSQLHLLERGKAQTVGSQVFDTLGTLNLWLADIRRGRAQPPEDAKLAEKAEQATVLEDSDGPFGPEEIFAVYVGRMQPPFSVTQLTPAQANQQSLVLARKIRKGMVEAGMDLVDDWSRFVAVYPTSDTTRLAKVRDVAQGRSTWSAEQVEDESAAVEIALAKLKRGSARAAAEGNK
jgi:hypothetical protein